MIWTLRQRLAAARAAFRNPKLAIPYYVGRDVDVNAVAPCPSYGCQLPDNHVGHHGLWYQWPKSSLANFPSRSKGSWAKVAELDSDR